MQDSSEETPPKPAKPGQYPRNPMHPRARALRVVMADRYLSIAEVAQLLGQATTTISRWRNGAPPPPEWMLRLLRHELAARVDASPA